jgi:hypothetical protein
MIGRWLVHGGEALVGGRENGGEVPAMAPDRHVQEWNLGVLRPRATRPPSRRTLRWTGCPKDAAIVTRDKLFA